jgi:CBS domain-containing protein
MKRNSYYDIDKIFLRGLTVRDIAEPLPSFDSQTPVEQVRSAMKHHHIQVAGIREEGFVAGYLELAELGETGPCGQYCHPIEEAKILSESAHLSDLVIALNQVPYLFVNFLGEISGIVTRTDLDDPPVRMWLFGLITLIELRFLILIERRFEGDGWQKYLSNSRLEKAAALQAERRRRNQDPRLLDCLQFSDKAQIIVRDENLRKQIGFASRRRGSEVIKNLEKLRNNLAHAQDIVSLDWETIVGISENLETVIRIGSGEG